MHACVLVSRGVLIIGSVKALAINMLIVLNQQSIQLTKKADTRLIIVPAKII